jgi:hypothetical protein
MMRGWRLFLRTGGEGTAGLLFLDWWVSVMRSLGSQKLKTADPHHLFGLASRQWRAFSDIWTCVA